MEATLNSPVLLSVLLSDGNTALYAQARLYNSLGSLVNTVDLPHVAEGMYQAEFTPNIEGYFSVVYSFYADSGYSVPANYDKMGETLDVNSFRTNILRLLGLQQENSLIDAQVTDVDGNLTSARLRCYNNRANTVAAAAISPATYSTGLLFSYDVSASYTSGQLTKYSILRST